MISLSEALAEEVRGTGVSVTVLCPGATRTGFQDRANVLQTPLMRFGLADAASVTKAGIEGMVRGKRMVIPGITNKLVADSRGQRNSSFSLLAGVRYCNVLRGR